MCRENRAGVANSAPPRQIVFNEVDWRGWWHLVSHVRLEQFLERCCLRSDCVQEARKIDSLNCFDLFSGFLSFRNILGVSLYEGQSVIVRSAVAFVFMLAPLSFSRASLDVVFFLSQLCRFEVARSVPLSQP